MIRGKVYGLSRMGWTTFPTDVRKVLLCQFHFPVNERFLYEYVSAICGNIRSASKPSSPSATRRFIQYALVGLVHHRPKIAVGLEAYMEKMEHHRRNPPLQQRTTKIRQGRAGRPTFSR